MVNIKSKKLEELICITLSKKIEDITTEDLESIKYIAINKRNLAGKTTDTCIEELSMFPKLEKCIISNFDILDEDIETLNKLENLSIVQFTGCTFININSKLNCKLNQVIIDICKNTNLDIISSKESVEILRIIGEKELDINKILDFKNITELDLRYDNIINTNKISSFESLKYLGINSNKTDDDKSIEDLKNKIEVEYVF